MNGNTNGTARTLEEVRLKMAEDLRGALQQQGATDLLRIFGLDASAYITALDALIAGEVDDSQVEEVWRRVDACGAAVRLIHRLTGHAPTRRRLDASRGTRVAFLPEYSESTGEWDLLVVQLGARFMVVQDGGEGRASCMSCGTTISLAEFRGAVTNGVVACQCGAVMVKNSWNPVHFLNRS